MDQLTTNSKRKMESWLRLELQNCNHILFVVFTLIILVFYVRKNFVTMKLYSNKIYVKNILIKFYELVLLRLNMFLIN